MGAVRVTELSALKYLTVFFINDCGNLYNRSCHTGDAAKDRISEESHEEDVYACDWNAAKSWAALFVPELVYCVYLNVCKNKKPLKLTQNIVSMLGLIEHLYL